MGDWTETYNDVFFISIATTMFMFLGTLVKYAFRSKCDNIDICCGTIKIHRRVELESSDDEGKQEEKKDNNI
jgi:hypothetical protein